VLAGAFLTPAGTPARALRTLSYRRDGKALCSRRYEWVELVAR
jgi:hypothetical protein